MYEMLCDSKVCCFVHYFDQKKQKLQGHLFFNFVEKNNEESSEIWCMEYFYQKVNLF